MTGFEIVETPDDPTYKFYPRFVGTDGSTIWVGPAARLREEAQRSIRELPDSILAEYSLGDAS